MRCRPSSRDGATKPSWSVRATKRYGSSRIRAQKPDLIICDYRLRDGANGIAVIDSLRSAYGEAIPAMLITGDTAPARLAEAKASGLPLLHKPVSNGKLRAAIVHLIAKDKIKDGIKQPTANRMAVK